MTSSLIDQTRGLTRHLRATVRGRAAASTSTSRAASWSPSSAPTAPASRPRLRMLTTLIAPTAGTATVAGHDVAHRPGRRPAPDRLRRPGQRRRPHPAGRATSWSARAAPTGSTGGRRTRRAAELLDALDLTALADRKVSDAVRRPAAPARRRDRAWCTGPALLFLDEPSTGLDPQNRANLWEHILRLRGRARDDDRAHHALPGRGRHDGRAGGRRSTTAGSSPTTPPTGSRRARRRPDRGRARPTPRRRGRGWPARSRPRRRDVAVDGTHGDRPGRGRSGARCRALLRAVPERRRSRPPRSAGRPSTTCSSP